MKSLPLLLVLFLPAFLPGQIQAFYPEQLVVTASALNLRESPDVNSKKVVTLNRGTVVEFAEAANGGEYVMVDSIYAPWLRVRYQDKTGYVFGAHVAGTYNLFFENELTDNIPAALNWYGIYQRDSFSDELRPVRVRLEKAWNEMYGSHQILKTDQEQVSKYLLATVQPLKKGYAGPLGMFEVRDMYVTDGLFPGATLAIHPGQEEMDTTMKPSYGLIVTGCATMQNMYSRVTDYRLQLLDYSTDPITSQDLTSYVRPESEEINPSVSLLWFGDIDHDNKPDAIIQDCPYEVGCRASLFLSSRARPGEFLKKVCEHFWPMD
jgi:hypothetical protein